MWREADVDLLKFRQCGRVNHLHGAAVRIGDIPIRYIRFAAIGTDDDVGRSVPGSGFADEGVGNDIEFPDFAAADQGSIQKTFLRVNKKIVRHVERRRIADFEQARDEVMFR